MRIILHIGVHKTGSTALQRCFSQNAEEFARRGVLYPATGRWPEGMPDAAQGHHRLAWSISRPNEVPNVWPDLREELERSECSTAILSSEAFSVLTTPAHITAVRDSLHHDVEVVVYLRRQDEYLHGLFSTEALYQGKDLDFDACKEKWLPRIDYRRVLNRWEAAFGRAGLVVRAYEAQQLRGGDIVSDFAHHAGVKWLAMLPVAGRERVINRSMPKNVLDLFRAARRHDVPEDSLAQLRQIAAWVYAGQNVEPDVMSPTARAELLASFRESNEFVARRYLGRSDGRLFLNDQIGDTDAWLQRYGTSRSSFETSIAEVWARIRQ